MSDKVIVVFGATGTQGGSVVDALLKDGWKVRGVTRNPDSEAAQKLAAKGVAIVKGAYGAFVVTNFWDPDSMGKEKEQGRNLVDAAKKEGVHHFVYSSLTNCQEISGGKYIVPHFTDKAVVEAYARKQGFPVSSFFYAGYYFTNWLYFFPPRKDEEGAWVYTFPKTSTISGFDPRDTGPIVAAIFKDPEGNNGKSIVGVADHSSPKEAFDTLSRVSGEKVKIVEVTREQFAAFGFPGAQELADMFAFFDEYTAFPNMDIDSGKKLYPQMKSWEDWIKDCWKPPATA